MGLEALKNKKSVAYERKLQCSEPDISLMLYGMSTCYKVWSIGVSCVCLLSPIPSYILKPPDYVIGLWLEHTMMLARGTSVKCIYVEDSNCPGSNGM